MFTSKNGSVKELEMRRDRISRVNGSASNAQATDLTIHLPSHPMPEAEPDVPPLTEEDRVALAEFHKRQQVLRDLTIGCIEHHHVGMHIYGPPGVSKSFTIQKTLKERKASCCHHQRVTAKPLYLELEKHPGCIHIVEDCEQLFSERSALTLLRSALGGERINGRRERRVSYSIAGSRARVLEHFFYGSIIFTSNRPLTDEKPEIRAVISRIPCMAFAPPDHEIRAVMRSVARQGYVGERGSMTAAECVEAVEYVIEQAALLDCRLDLRWTEHAFAHFLTEANAGTTVDWRDMVKFHMMNTLTYFDHTRPAKQGPTAEDDHNKLGTLPQEILIAREIAGLLGQSREERLARWEERTSLSRATYYRRLRASQEDLAAE
jgi:hypothetical protein